MSTQLFYCTLYAHVNSVGSCTQVRHAVKVNRIRVREKEKNKRLACCTLPSFTSVLRRTWDEMRLLLMPFYPLTIDFIPPFAELHTTQFTQKQSSTGEGNKPLSTKKQMDQRAFLHIRRDIKFVLSCASCCSCYDDFISYSRLRI